VSVSIRRLRRPNPATPVGTTPIGVSVALGASSVIVAALVAASIPSGFAALRFGVIAATVFGYAAVSRVPRAVGVVALIGLLISNGFLEDHFGQLVWHGSADIWRALLLVVFGALGSVAGEGYRFVIDLRRRYRKADRVVLSATSLEEEKHGA
jgi:hypothetical protein